MKIDLILVGKDKESWVKELSTEFIKRLSKYCDLEIILVADENIDDSQGKIAMKKEGDKIISKLKDGYKKIALDVTGKQYSSEDFSRFILKLKDQEGGKVQFIIGGAYGISQDVLARMDYKLSLSSLTFTHQMTRVILLEQLYRAFSIIQGSAYHKN